MEFITARAFARSVGSCGRLADDALNQVQHPAMIAIIILGLLCLPAASVVLRVVLFILDSNDHGRLAKIAPIAGSIGSQPLIAFEWAPKSS